MKKCFLCNKVQENRLCPECTQKILEVGCTIVVGSLLFIAVIALIVSMR